MDSARTQQNGAGIPDTLFAGSRLMHDHVLTTGTRKMTDAIFRTILCSSSGENEKREIGDEEGGEGKVGKRRK